MNLSSDEMLPAENQVTFYVICNKQSYYDSMSRGIIEELFKDCLSSTRVVELEEFSLETLYTAVANENSIWIFLFEGTGKSISRWHIAYFFLVTSLHPSKSIFVLNFNSKTEYNQYVKEICSYHGISAYNSIYGLYDFLEKIKDDRHLCE